jgi:antitoxin component YwqK of YwqJK toxin-antitoxin module
LDGDYHNTPTEENGPLKYYCKDVNAKNREDIEYYESGKIKKICKYVNNKLKKITEYEDEED